LYCGCIETNGVQPLARDVASIFMNCHAYIELAPM